MKKTCSTIILSIMTLGIFVFSAVCWHSISEIHYLKSFFPRQFSVQDAYYASAIELIKVIIIGLPILFITASGIYLLRHFSRER